MKMMKVAIISMTVNIMTIPSGSSLLARVSRSADVTVFGSTVMTFVKTTSETLPLMLCLATRLLSYTRNTALVARLIMASNMKVGFGPIIIVTLFLVRFRSVTVMLKVRNEVSRTALTCARRATICCFVLFLPWWVTQHGMARDTSRTTTDVETQGTMPSVKTDTCLSVLLANTPNTLTTALCRRLMRCVTVLGPMFGIGTKALRWNISSVLSMNSRCRCSLESPLTLENTDRADVVIGHLMWLFVVLTVVPVFVAMVMFPIMQVCPMLFPPISPVCPVLVGMRFVVSSVVKLMLAVGRCLSVHSSILVMLWVSPDWKLIPGRWCRNGTRLFLKLGPIPFPLAWVHRFPRLWLVAPLRLELTLWLMCACLWWVFGVGPRAPRCTGDLPGAVWVLGSDVDET